MVWTDWWPLDTNGAATRSAGTLGRDDPRVQHFYEPDRALGKAVSRSLGWEDPDADENAAWDIYLFYPPGARWDAAMPAPYAMLHQLASHRDEVEFKTGDDLVAALRKTTAALLEKPAS